MYNESLKFQYIELEDKDSRRRWLTWLFERTEPLEEAASKDICQMTLEELTGVFKLVSGNKTVSRVTAQTALRTYCRWCISQGVEGANDLTDQLDMKDLEPYRKRMLANPQHMLKLLNERFDDTSEGTIHIIYRAYLWMAYFGMFEDQAIDVKTSDVSLSRLIIKTGGEEFEICREAIPDFEWLVEKDHFNYKHPKYKNVIVRERVPGDTLLRGVHGQTTIKSFRARIGVRLNALPDEDNPPTISSIRLSGLYYRTLQREQIGMQPSFRPIVRRIIMHRNGGAEPMQHNLVAQARDMARDYELWKEAFRV